MQIIHITQYLWVLLQDYNFVHTAFFLGGRLHYVHTAFFLGETPSSLYILRFAVMKKGLSQTFFQKLNTPRERAWLD